jgi:predicted MFS family arabinose efflux permease
MQIETALARPTGLFGFDALQRRGLLVAAGATIGMATGFGCLALTSVLIQTLASEFGWTRSALSTCYTLAAGGMAVGGVFWGRVSDRVDIRYLLVLGSVFIVLPLLVMSRADALWQFYAANLVLGLFGFGAINAPLVAAAAEWFDHRRGLVTGAVTAGGALGQGIMPFSAHALIDHLGWRSALFVIAVAVLALQLVVVTIVRRRHQGQASTANAGAAQPFRPLAAPRLLALALAAFLCCLCMGVPLLHLAGFVATVCGSGSLGATCLLVAMSCGAVGRICFGLGADRIGPLASYAMASALQSLCIVGFPFLETALPLVALSAVFGFGFAGNMTSLLLCVRKEVPAAHFGGAMGIVMFVGWAGMGVGGYLGGALFDATGTYLPAFLAAAASGAANLMVLAGLALVAGAGRRSASAGVVIGRPRLGEVRP